MSMGWRIRWTKAEKARCDFKAKQALFAVGADAAHGRFENIGVMDSTKASFLWLLAGEFNKGKPGREAYEAAEASLTDLGRERLNADTTPPLAPTVATDGGAACLSGALRPLTEGDEV